YAKKGFVDHQTLSSDAYLKFIEDDFLGGARLDPATDGRPDPRPDVRENEPMLGNLVEDFNFSQAPRPPVLLPTNPLTDSPSIPADFTAGPSGVGCTAPPVGGRRGACPLPACLRRAAVPGDQLGGGEGVDHPAGRDTGHLGPAAAAVEPVELAGRVRVGVD